MRLAAIVAAGVVLRLDAAAQWSLHPWDERFHALVARNLAVAPLAPTLVPSDYLDAVASDWQRAHVWLHKPPLALWAMAASMAAFGVSEVALRLPSVLASAIGVYLAFSVGRVTLSENAGLVAAYLYSANAFLVSLAAGRRVADHVDVMLIVTVQAAMWCLVKLRPVAAGTFCGLALLAKSSPALVVPVVAVVTRRQRSEAVRWSLLVCGVAAIIAGPWTLFTWLRFPIEAQFEAEYTLRHFTEVLEGHGGSWLSYFLQMPRHWGEFVYVALGWFAYGIYRRHEDPGVRVLAAWASVPYLVFSCAATKLPNMVAIAAPALFAIQAAGWCELRAYALTARGWKSYGMRIVLVLALILPVRSLLEPTGPMERRERHPPRTYEFRELAQHYAAGRAAVFGVPDPIECMFYSGLACYSRLPTDGDVQRLRAGTKVLIAAPLSAKWPAWWGATALPALASDSH